MKTFCCGDVVPGCSSRWELPDDQAILTAVADHAAAVHGITEVSPELVEAVRSNIRLAA